MLTRLAYSSSAWSGIGWPIADHLWQSTLFVGVAALLAFLLRRNHAQVRYWLWLTASAKFLIPFSLLTSLGSHMDWSRNSTISQTRFLFVMQEFGVPFAPAKQVHPVGVFLPELAAAVRFLAAIFLIVWLCGCAVVLFFWWMRWRRMTAAIRGVSPVKSGREFEALRRLERSAGIERPVHLIASTSKMEPGILGIFRPVLLLPPGISDLMNDAQLEAIIMHELCHVRRHDNLAAALHMLVEALFWFHPLVWWIGGRLIDERERACDEDVVSLGSEPQVYAESILKVCEFYLESPLFCSAAVTGSNLKERIEAIMSNRIASKLDWGKKILLGAIAVVVVAVPVTIGILNPALGRAQSQPTPAERPAPKFLLGDLKIEGDVHNRVEVKDRILNERKGREYDQVTDLTEEVMEVGIRRDFQDRGYFKVFAKDPVTQPLGLADGKQSFLLITTVTEGDQFRLGNFTIQNDHPDQPLSIPVAALREQFHLRQGDLFNVSEIQRGLKRVNGLYNAKGFGEASEQPATAIDDAHHLISFTLRITEGLRTK